MIFESDLRLLPLNFKLDQNISKSTPKYSCLSTLRAYQFPNSALFILNNKLYL